MTQPSEQPSRKGDIVVYRGSGQRGQPRGIVVNRFIIGDRDMGLLPPIAPVEPGEYVVVLWHGRMRMRVESAADLEKVGAIW